MPKIKTHSGAKKRFKISGSGKVRHQQANRGHLMEGKTSRRARKLALDEGLSKGDSRIAKRLLGLR